MNALDRTKLSHIPKKSLQRFEDHHQKICETIRTHGEVTVDAIIELLGDEIQMSDKMNLRRYLRAIENISIRPMRAKAARGTFNHSNVNVYSFIEE